MHLYVSDLFRNLHKCIDTSVQLDICIYMYIHGIYMFTIVCTGINMYIHGIDVYIPLCQILSIWSGFQMCYYSKRWPPRPGGRAQSLPVRPPRSIWNPDHMDRIWQSGIYRSIPCIYMFIPVHSFVNMYIPCIYMYIHVHTNM